MRGFVPPSVGAGHWGRSSDEIDELLRAYFRQQLPNPWPELKLPAETLRAKSNRRLWSSRSALAAALAFLLIGSLALSAYRGSLTAAHSGAGPFTANGDPFGFAKPQPENDSDDLP